MNDVFLISISIIIPSSLISIIISIVVILIIIIRILLVVLVHIVPLLTLVLVLVLILILILKLIHTLIFIELLGLHWHFIELILLNLILPRLIHLAHDNLIFFLGSRP